MLGLGAIRLSIVLFIYLLLSLFVCLTDDRLSICLTVKGNVQIFVKFQKLYFCMLYVLHFSPIQWIGLSYAFFILKYCHPLIPPPPVNLM